MSAVTIGTRLRQAAWLVLFFGLAAGLGDLLVIACKKILFDRWAYLGPQVVWMSPLSYVMVLALIALIIAPFFPLPVLVFLLALLSTAGSLTVMHPWLATWAIAILSLGVAARIAATARVKPEGVLSAARRSVPFLLVVILLLTIGVNLLGLLRSRRAEKALDAPPPAGAPNVLLVILDAVAAPSMSAYGFDQPTSPRLERLAAQGVRFHRAFAPAPWTIPTHASFFTGRQPHELAADWDTPLGDADSTLAEIFRARGWRSAGFTGNTAMMIGESGLGRGFEPYDYQHISPGNILFHGGLVRFAAKNRVLRRVIGEYRLLERRWGSRVAGEFLGWLDDHRDRPFFAMVNIYDAHEPYTAPEDLRRRFAPNVRQPGLVERVRNRGQPARREFHPADSADQRALYHASIAQGDAALGGLLDALEQRGVLGNTVVVVASDHGEEFFEHREWGHSQTLYHMALRVPLVVSWPGRVPAGVVVDSTVEARRLYSTVLDLAGIADAPAGGRSLARFWGAGEPADTAVSSRTSPRVLAREGFASRSWSLVAGDLHYIRGLDRAVQLFDYVADPFELRDLAGDPAHAEALAVFGRFIARLEPGTP